MKKLLFSAVVIYFLGVVGVGGGYMANNWSSEWGFGEQFASAVRVGITWPSLIFGIAIRV